MTKMLAQPALKFAFRRSRTSSTIRSMSSSDRIARSIFDSVVRVSNWRPSRAAIALNDPASSPNSSRLATSTLAAKSLPPRRRVPSINCSSGTRVRRICVRLNSATSRTERTTLPQKIALKGAIGPSATASGWAATTIHRGAKNFGLQKQFLKIGEELLLPVLPGELPLRGLRRAPDQHADRFRMERLRTRQPGVGFVQHAKRRHVRKFFRVPPEVAGVDFRGHEAQFRRNRAQCPDQHNPAAAARRFAAHQHRLTPAQMRGRGLTQGHHVRRVAEQQDGAFLRRYEGHAPE